MCEPVHETETESQGRGVSHPTPLCGMCSAEDHRDTGFYEPPHQVGHHRLLSG
jgi:hypothetical protein